MPSREVGIERAVWSFWSRPFLAHAHDRWASQRFHLLSWVLSFFTIAARFPTTALVTDDAGAQLLVDDLELPFDDVSTSLNKLSAADARWWVLGKLHAYREQNAPFIHFDNDVFLWKPLPASLRQAAILTQNPEYAPTTDETFYKPTRFTKAVAGSGGYLPPELYAYVRGGGATALCMGVFGGCDVDYLTRYADRSIATIQHADNVSVWDGLGIGLAEQLLMEQYYIAAYWADLCHNNAHRPQLRHLFASQQEAFSPSASRRLGFTHLIAAAKRQPAVAQLIEDRVQADYPSQYKRACGAASACDQV
jgi:hypothetical protein